MRPCCSSVLPCSISLRAGFASPRHMSTAAWGRGGICEIGIKRRSANDSVEWRVCFICFAPIPPGYQLGTYTIHVRTGGFPPETAPRIAQSHLSDNNRCRHNRCRHNRCRVFPQSLLTVWLSRIRKRCFEGHLHDEARVPKRCTWRIILPRSEGAQLHEADPEGPVTDEVITRDQQVTVDHHTFRRQNQRAKKKRCSSYGPFGRELRDCRVLSIQGFQ